MSRDGLSSVSARRGWGWVFGGGAALALLSTYPALTPTVAGWAGWLVIAAARLVWGAAWWVPGVVAVLVLLALAAVAVVGARIWRRWDW